MLSGNTIFSNTAEHYEGGGLYLSFSDAMFNGNTVSSNTANGSGGGLFLEGSDATLSGNTVTSNTADWGGGGLVLYHSDATLNGNAITFNSGGQDVGGGLWLHTSDATLINNIVTDNQADLAGSGLYIMCSSPRLVHTTIARNVDGDGSGVYVTMRWCATPSAIVLTNTILVSHSVGISVTAGNTATLESTLWHGNGADTGGAGTIVTSNDYTGAPAFAADGYHLTASSAAIDKGVDAGVATDIDGQIRDSQPDIGADEYIGAPKRYVYLPLVMRQYE
jgi:parallel beta-helix repeat protein